MPNHGANVAALSLVVIINWLLAHIATNWAMPSEVQSALQSLLTLGLGYWLARQPRPLPNGNGASGGALSSGDKAAP